MDFAFSPEQDLLRASAHGALGAGSFFVLAWFVASAATIGGGLGFAIFCPTVG